jgi:mono/diheme cytochrome c family protein
MKRNLFAIALGVVVGASPAVLADGAKTYTSKCANCHGKDGKGETAMGKKKGAKDLGASKMTVEEIVKVVTEGKNNAEGKPASPAFKDKLQADEINAVSAYVKATFMK